MLPGLNGAGKTSLIRAALGLETPSGGVATLGGADTCSLAPVTRARSLSCLPQIRPLAWPNTVRDLVALGRFSHGAGRRAEPLSGREIARMHCARAFATEAPLLIADEPTAALDPRHQFRILDLIADHVANGGGALVVLHDIHMAARYASRLIWMQDGRILADGPPAETLTTERLEQVYGIRVQINGPQITLQGPS